MKINGYELNLSEEQLDDIINNKMRKVELVSKDFAGYKNLTEGNKKALQHLVAAAKIFDEVAMEQDHEMNLPMKKALEEAAQINTHAAARGESVNGFINRAISEAMERDNAAPGASDGPAQGG